MDQQFRFEVVNKADTETFELLEVSDGLSFWQFRKSARHASAVGASRYFAGPHKTPGFWYRERSSRLHRIWEDCSESLALLRHYFRFESAEKESLEGLPVWRVAGQWNTTVLAAILPQQTVMPPDALRGMASRARA